MKQTNDSKQRPNHFTIVPPAGQTKRQTIAAVWTWVIKNHDTTVEFSGGALDLVGEDRRRPLVAIMALQFYEGIAVQILAGSGWKYNPETRRASRISKGHEGKDLLVECVWAIYTAKYRGVYRKTNHKGKTIVRREIATALAPYFDAKELSPGTRAPIDSAIRNGEKRMTLQPSSEVS